MQRFEVAPSNVFRERALYEVFSANTFLREAAIDRDFEVPRLPIDSGYLSFNATNSMVSCYGPALYYKNHKNYAGATSPGTCTVSGAANGCLPTGDLGLWSATNGSNGEACAAAKMNSKMFSTGFTSPSRPRPAPASQS